ncbi:syntaxin-17-like [Ornithodoros turicata]
MNSKSVSSNRTPPSTEGCVTQGKFPLKRLEVVIHRIIGVAIPLHLDILSKQKENIHKHQQQRQWDKLHMEQLNASRTVQQLKADLHELDNVRNQVCAADIMAFERQVLPVQNDVLQRTLSFTEMYLKLRTDGVVFQTQATDIDDIPLEECKADEPEPQYSILADEIPTNTAAFKSWTTLHKDLIDLNAMVHAFSRLVFEQKENVESIADHITQAEENVVAGTKSLGKAAKLQKAVLPVAGALLGVAVGGPVGLAIGVKMGLACALGGSLLGFTGGKALQYRQSKSEPHTTTPCDGIELKDLQKAAVPDSEQRNSHISDHKNKIQQRKENNRCSRNI